MCYILALKLQGLGDEGKISASCREHQHRIGGLFRIKSSRCILNAFVAAVRQHSASISVKDVTTSRKDAETPNT